MAEQKQSALMPVETPSGVDPWLATFVRIANRGGGEVQVTLNVGGTLVSGKLVGAKEYFQGVINEFQKATEGLSPQSVAYWRDIGKQIAELPAAPKEEEGKEELVNLPAFIHLMNARFFYPNAKPIPANRGVWWRGRLDAVDGFAFGELLPA
jgi:hypothetical protein